jgi:hypothetical protein
MHDAGTLQVFTNNVLETPEAFHCDINTDDLAINRCSSYTADGLIGLVKWTNKSIL